MLRTIPTKACEALGSDGAQVEGEEKAGFVCVCLPVFFRQGFQFTFDL